MDRLYSLTLLLGLLAAAGGLGSALWARLRGDARARRAGVLLIATAAVASAASLAAHRVYGHGPGSGTPLDWEDFWREHPAFFLAFGLVLLAMMALPGARKDS